MHRQRTIGYQIVYQGLEVINYRGDEPAGQVRHQEVQTRGTTHEINTHGSRLAEQSTQALIKVHNRVYALFFYGYGYA